MTSNISKYPIIKLVKINQTPLNISRNLSWFIISNVFVRFTENLDPVMIVWLQYFLFPTLSYITKIIALKCQERKKHPLPPHVVHDKYNVGRKCLIVMPGQV